MQNTHQNSDTEYLYRLDAPNTSKDKTHREPLPTSSNSHGIFRTKKFYPVPNPLSEEKQKALGACKTDEELYARFLVRF
jgi:hypothetical protein